jgi:type I restriction enzyme S subunit
MRCRIERNLLLSEFAIRWLCGAHAIRHFRSRAKSAIAQASINQQDVCCLSIPVPSLKEQEQITLRISSAERLAVREQEDHAKLMQVKQGLRHDLLTGRVRVPAT